jgi:hypothetical protein
VLTALSPAGAGTVVAVLSGFLAFGVFTVIIGDCAPGQQDGQCGLGTFMSEILAFGSACVVWLFATLVLYRRFAKRFQKG